jgi:hypothetical protein
MKLTSRELKDFFVGCLLGDGYLDISGAFHVKQVSKDLIDFKAMVIQKNLANVELTIKEYEARIDKNGVNHQKYWLLTAKKMEYFKKLRREFYPNGKKIIPKKYVRKLHPIGYAMWYADDGTTILVGKNQATGSARSRRVQFCTDNFELTDVKLFANILEAQFGNVKLVHRKSQQYRLQINGKNAQSFLELIAIYFETYFPSLLYKMDLGYRNQSLFNRCYVNESYHNLYTKMSAHSQFKDRMIGR